MTVMGDSERAAKVIETLKAAEREPAQSTVPALKELVGVVQGNSDNSLEADEAEATGFMAVCEVAKALHRGAPAAHLWKAAIGAAERWKSLV